MPNWIANGLSLRNLMKAVDAIVDIKTVVVRADVDGLGKGMAVLLDPVGGLDHFGLMAGAKHRGF